MRNSLIWKMLSLLLLAVPALVGAAGGAGDPAGLAESPEIPKTFCYTKLNGMGICAFDETASCGPFANGSLADAGLAECDAATPCADGSVCVVGSGCPTSLAGVCWPTPFQDGACANPGTTQTGFAPCEPVLFHEDFDDPPMLTGGIFPGLDKLSITGVCGGSSTFFKEDSCELNLFASSPLETAAWGILPGGCTDYAGGDVRAVAATGPIDVSGCDSALLDFDYAIDFDSKDSPSYDRFFVTVREPFVVRQEGPGVPYERVLATNQRPGGQAFSVESMSCGGGVLPVGTLVQDGAWHHFRAALHEGPFLAIRFWVETADSKFNSGQGVLFDDVVVQCGDRIFNGGFEGANFLRWSETTAPPQPLEVYQSGACKDYVDCGGIGSGCLNFTTAEKTAYCINASPCEKSAECASSSDCDAGSVCVVDSCCGFSLCVPNRCDPGSGGILLLADGPTSGG